MSQTSPPEAGRRRRWVFGLVAGLALVAGVTAAYLWQVRGARAAADRLLALQLPDPAGRPLAFAQWRGKPLVVNFWATWCAPCREEMPMLDRLAGSRPEVQFVGIGIDRAEAVQQFQRQTPVRFPLAVSGLELSPLAADLGNTAMALPFTVFLHADGRIEQIKLGALKEAELTQVLDRLAPSEQAASSAK